MITLFGNQNNKDILSIVMTDKEKLQKLFEAALREAPSAPGHAPRRAFPVTSTPRTAVPQTGPILKPAPAVSKDVFMPLPSREW
jgi:hypothetical protein